MKPITIFSFLVLVNILLTSFAMQAKADTIENYQIYLKDEIVIRESDYRNPHSTPVKFLALDQTNFNDFISVNYSHCTAGAGNRKIIIKDKDKILLSKTFPDKEEEALMVIPVKEIYDKLNGEASSGLEMYYYDDQLSSGGELLTFLHANKLPDNYLQERKTKRTVMGSGVIIILIASLVAIRRRKKQLAEKQPADSAG
jgi:regulator of extracellular matrix RemA (YlzA/DUF370 family)